MSHLLTVFFRQETHKKTAGVKRDYNRLGNQQSVLSSVEEHHATNVTVGDSTSSGRSILKHTFVNEVLASPIIQARNRDRYLNKFLDLYKVTEVQTNFWECVSIWGCSSVGRAIALQAKGRRFDSVQLHQFFCPFS